MVLTPPPFSREAGRFLYKCYGRVYDERPLMSWINEDLRESSSGLCCWVWGVGLAGGCCSSGSGSSGGSSSGGSDSNIGGGKGEKVGGVVGGVRNAQAPQLRPW